MAQYALVSQPQSPASVDLLSWFACIHFFCGKRLFDGPPHFKSQCYARATFESQRSSPLGKCLGLTVKSEIPASSGVCVLLLNGSPSAVFGTIIAIIIDSVQGVLGAWPWSHIPEKSRKPMWSLPPLAYGDPSSAIIMVSAIGRFFAALLHPNPASILGLCFGCGAKPVRDHGFPSSFYSKTSAALGFPGGNLKALYEFFSPAIAATKPIVPRPYRMREGQESKTVEFFPSKVFFHELCV